VQRRLAAILVADVVGYSRLMAADEARTLAALKERRAGILEPVVKSRSGRIVKFMGDGVLIEFASAVNAVNAALELQEKFASTNANVEEDRRIVLRIGINLGDVIGEGSDIFGDGVNIAARLEALAEPGGICISGQVYDAVRGKIKAGFDDFGEQQLKNIAIPVRALHLSGAKRGEVNPPAKHGLSIAVLPFANFGGDPDQQFFSDGFTEDIITELSRFRQLRVIARNSSFRFRGSDLDMSRVGRELGAAYLVEGSVRRMGSRIRITAQLIEVKTGHHVWADKFDRNLDDVFSTQDQLVRTIVTVLTGRLQAASTETARRKPPTSLEAYECVLRADALPHSSPATVTEARKLLEQAIGLDPSYARAYALLAINLANEWETDLNAPESLLDRAFELAKKSVALDEHDSLCVGTMGLVCLDRGAFDMAEHYYRKALEINPNHASILVSFAYSLCSLGRPEEALARLNEARTIEPHFEPTWYWNVLSEIHLANQNYEEAIAAIESRPEPSIWQHFTAAICYVRLDRITEARRHIELATKNPDISLSRIMSRILYKREQDRQRYVEDLRKAGLPE
jgi:TolB-like protein/tetratricopeptide (TPR) repeat protein